MPLPSSQDLWPSSRCKLCRHRRVIRSKRGSEFWMCARSATDERYAKYPPQPLVRCRGFEPMEGLPLPADLPQP
ncbi:MAG: hypothetical protein OHK0039_14190 [Bacteroidia bacterium]